MSTWWTWRSPLIQLEIFLKIKYLFISGFLKASLREALWLFHALTCDGWTDRRNVKCPGWLQCLWTVCSLGWTKQQFHVLDEMGSWQLVSGFTGLGPACVAHRHWLQTARGDHRWVQCPGSPATCFVRKDYQCFYGQISFKELVFEFPKDGARYTGDPSHPNNPTTLFENLLQIPVVTESTCSPPF